MSAAQKGSPHRNSYITRFVAIACTAAALFFSWPHDATRSERRDLAKRFRFMKFDLPVEQYAVGKLRHKHPLHPSLQRICQWVSATGASVTLADIDGDGLPNDLCLADPRINRLMVMPVPGTGERYQPFSPDPRPLAVDPDKALPTGAVVGDFNEDGMTDLLVYYWGRTPILHIRKTTASESRALGPADFHPSELVPSGTAEPIRWYTHAASQADVDGDGHLDLVMGNFFRENADVFDPHGTGVAKVMHAGKSKALNGGGPKLFLWSYATTGERPTAQFRDASQTIVDLTDKGWVLAVGAADLDNDMRPEIYFADDFGPDRLLHNRSTPGHPAFALAEGRRDLSTPKSCVLGNDSFKGMGVDFADVNHDGLLDIYVSNIADDMALHESHFVWLSNGHTGEFREGVAPYDQGSEKLGMSRSGWGWDSKFGDLDNDGEPEALQATGFIKGHMNCWPELQALGTSNDRIVSDPRLWPKLTEGADISGHNHNPFFVRSQDGTMVDIAAELGMDQPFNSRGVALADVDGDGRLDFAIANQWERSYFFKNESPRPGAFLGLHLLLPVGSGAAAEFRMRAGHPGSDTPGRPAIGARAAVTAAEGRILVDQLDGGSGHAGRSSPQIHFGLGSAPADQPLDVQLTWRDAHGNLQDRSIRVTPGWHTVVLGSDPTPAILSQR